MLGISSLGVSALASLNAVIAGPFPYVAFVGRSALTPVQFIPTSGPQYYL